MAERFHEVSLQRSGPDAPWGFRLTENSRFPTVVRVNPNSVAANVVLVGDLILKIGQQFTEGRPYTDILQMIKNEGNVLHLVIDRGGTQHSLWSSNTSGYESISSPTSGVEPAFSQGLLRHNESENPKPFTYTAAPDQLAEELRMRHDAMKRDRQQNLVTTARSRQDRTDSPNFPQQQQQRYLGNKAVMAGMPRFTMAEPKDFTQSDVYRLSKEMENAEKEMRNLEIDTGYTQPQPTSFNQPQPASYSQPQPTYSTTPTESTQFTHREEQQSVRFDDNVTRFGSNDYDDDDYDHDFQPGEVGDYSQKSIRYLGRNIPSKSFKMLQSLIGDDESQNGQFKGQFPGAGAPMDGGAKSSMRSVKSRAAQRKQAGGGGGGGAVGGFAPRSANDGVGNVSMNPPTSPHSDGFNVHQKMFQQQTEEQQTSFTDF